MKQNLSKSTINHERSFLNVTFSFKLHFNHNCIFT